MAHALTLLDERAAEWRGLPRATPQERAGAEAYYEAQVLPLLLAQAREREHVHLPQRYRGLILAVGDDPTSALISLVTIAPERLHLLYTFEGERAVERVARECALGRTPYERTRVEEPLILEAYGAVREVCEAWGGAGAVAVDITGGPAPSSAGMAMAAYALGADLVAVEAEELWPDTGHARPGSQHLTFPAQPYVVFGDLVRREAEEAYGRAGYAAAHRLCALLAETVDRTLYAPYRDLAAAYEAWDAFAAGSAWQAMCAAVQALEAAPGHPLTRWLGRLRAQAAALARLAPLEAEQGAPAELPERDLELLRRLDLVLDLAFTLFEAVGRRAQAGHYAEAVLLQYRLLELLAQRRLALRGLDTVHPDYSLLGVPDLGEVLARLRRERLAQADAGAQLPEHIGLSTALLILEALGDPLTPAIAWPLLAEALPARSRSVLEHGFCWPGRGACLDFGRLLEPILARFCEVEGCDRARLEHTYRFVEAGE